MLTKPDLINPGGEAEVLEVLSNNRKPLKLGYVMVKVIFRSMILRSNSIVRSLDGLVSTRCRCTVNITQYNNVSSEEKQDGYLFSA